MKGSERICIQAITSYCVRLVCKDFYICKQYCTFLDIYYLPPAAEGRGREIIKCLLSVRPFITFLHKP